MTTKKSLKQLFEENGYTNIAILDGKICGICEFLFTTAIIREMSCIGYADRWCYKTTEEAVNAISLWDGKGHPGGEWTRALIKNNEVIIRGSDGLIYDENDPKLIDLYK